MPETFNEIECKTTSHETSPLDMINTNAGSQQYTIFNGPIIKVYKRQEKN